jgi:hypothetical protein
VTTFVHSVRRSNIQNLHWIRDEVYLSDLRTSFNCHTQFLLEPDIICLRSITNPYSTRYDVSYLRLYITDDPETVSKYILNDLGSMTSTLNRCHFHLETSGTLNSLSIQFFISFSDSLTSSKTHCAF